MIYSMTGYGEATRQIGQDSYRIEVKSLNGKNADIRFKSNSNLRDKEIKLRKIILEKGLRGKFEVNLTRTNDGADDSSLNTSTMNKYYDQLAKFAEGHGLDKGDVLQTLVRLPNVVQTGEEEITEEEWKELSMMVEEAVQKLNTFRETEGVSLEKDLKTRVNNIQEALAEVSKYEADRIETVKQRIQKNLNQHMNEENVDKNRFEQEILFYIEKLDINEEKVRLAQHCKFFLEEIDKPVMQKGRKLNFVGQEIGREINTLGAKAQHSDIQQLVVKMKDELEKLKEQILNIL